MAEDETRTVDPAGSRLVRKATPACLVVIHGEGLGTRVALGADPLVLGRSKSCGFQLDDDAVSRKHARIEAVGVGHRLSDLGSKNGTLVNDERCDHWSLRDGDVVTIGRTLFKHLRSDSLEAAYLEALHRMATVDSLTQLANEATLTAALARIDAGALVLMELASFQEINDQHGQLTGDYVLRALAGLLERLAGDADVCARCAGASFALLVAGGGDAARAFRQRVLEELCATVFAFDGQELTVDMAVAVVESGEDASEAPSSMLMRARELLRAQRVEDRGHKALVVGPAGAWFERTGPRVDLSRRGPLRQILEVLAQARLAGRNTPLQLPEVVAAGWPGERMADSSAKSRAYVAISTLRKLGLDGVLVTSGGGYVLHPAVQVRRG